MVSRAEKKLFLNAIVGEIDPDEALEEDSTQQNTEIELSHALGRDL
jgi:hypothetical protein